MRIERTSQSGRYVVERLFSARTYAFICSPYISQEYAWEIVKLAEKGVLVKVLTSDKVVERDFYIRTFFAEVKRQKQGGRLETLKTLVMNHRGQSFEHSKMYVIDDQYAVTGSANLTRPGMWQNGETINIYQIPAEVRAVREAFENAWKDALASAFGNDASIGSHQHNSSNARSNGRPNYYDHERMKNKKKASNKGSVFDLIKTEIKNWTGKNE